MLTKDIKIQIPSNLLLAGEYIITQKGGLGLSIAVNNYAYLKVKENNTCKYKIKSQVYKRTWEYCQNDEIIPKFLQNSVRILDVLHDEFKDIIDGKYLDFFVDTSNLFSKNYQKLGLGSSAVTALGICFVFLKFYNIKESLIPLVICVLQKANFFIGSLYEIYTSYLGGALKFSGGRPVESCQNVKLSDFSMSLGFSHSVKSANSLKKFENWKNKSKENQKFLEDFIKKSNSYINFLSTENIQTFLCYMQKLKDMYVNLGQKISVLSRAPDVKNHFTKCLGAGDECFVIIPKNRNYFDLKIDNQGLKIL